LKVTLSTRSRSKELTKRVQDLFDCKCITNRQSLYNTTDWGYNYTLFFETDADWVIHTDEDFFLLDSIFLDKLFEYIKDKDYDVIGGRGPSCQEIVDTTFIIANLNRIKKFKPSKAELLLVRLEKPKDLYPNCDWKDGYWSGDRVENLYLNMLEKGCKFNFFEYDKGIFDTQVYKTKNLSGQEIIIGYHTSCARHWRNDNESPIKNITEKIDKTYDYVRRKRNEKHLSNS
jgi:hypothetical protein